jgi:hypothetical protein
MKRIITATITAALLTIAATTAQAGWEDGAAVFAGLFGSDSSAVVVAYFEDGSFVIEDDSGHTYKGCEVGAPCDDSATMTTHVYIPAVSK